jgi:hypothetical protein
VRDSDEAFSVRRLDLRGVEDELLEEEEEEAAMGLFIWEGSVSVFL